MFSKDFLKAAAERAAKTFVQTLAALITASRFDWFSADWGQLLGTAAAAAVASVLTSMASEPFGPTGTPSLVAEPPKIESKPVYGKPDNKL